MNELQSSPGYYSKLKDRIMLFRKEWFGVNYLLFTPYRLLSSLSIIFFAGVLPFFYHKNGFSDSTTDAMQIQWDLLDDYVFGLNIAITVVVWYFVIYQWTTIHKNGDYGYWISLGVQRSKFFVTSLLTLVTSMFIAVLSSYIVITTVGGLDFVFQDTLLIQLILISNIILLTGIAWLFTELISKFEVVSLLFLGGVGLGNFIFKDNNNPIFDILYPTLDLGNYQLILNLLVPLLIGLGLLFASYKLSLKREIEI